MSHQALNTLFILLQKEIENKALRLKLRKDAAYDNTDPSLVNASLLYFNEESYISKGRLKPGEDAYHSNKFNQEASDKLQSNRPIPDYRHKK